MCTFCLASIGLWTFIDHANNLRNPSANITTLNTPFVPAVQGGNTNVISLFGHKDSYILLESPGELASFTWSAMIFLESNGTRGSMFNVWSDSSECGYLLFDILLNINDRLKVRICNGSSISPFRGHYASVHQWHEVAASYDGETHSLQMYVDGKVYFRTDVFLGQGMTTGPVVVGSRYYYSNPNSPDTHYFHGKMACMRLWNIARDLNTMRMDTPLCKFN